MEHSSRKSTPRQQQPDFTQPCASVVSRVSPLPCGSGLARETTLVANTGDAPKYNNVFHFEMLRYQTVTVWYGDRRMSFGTTMSK